jgi:hypothetical protein
MIYINGLKSVVTKLIEPMALKSMFFCGLYIPIQMVIETEDPSSPKKALQDDSVIN